MVITMKYVLINKLCELYGYSRNAIYAYVKKGIWIEGIHFVKKQGRLYFNTQAIERWVEGKAA